MKILLIDDDVMLRRTVARVLQSAGHDVTTAQDGLDGMRMFHKTRPDLVITDIYMPRQEGFETILALRRENPSLGIIAISGGSMTGSREMLDIAGNIGANSILEKPFTMAELLDCVRAFASPAAAAEDPAD